MTSFLFRIIDTIYDWALEMGDSKTFYEHKETGKLYFSWGSIDLLIIDEDDTAKEYVHLRPIKVFVNQNDEKDTGYSWNFSDPAVYVTKETLKKNYKKTRKLNKVKEL